jgi:hypothetical protein
VIASGPPETIGAGGEVRQAISARTIKVKPP